MADNGHMTLFALHPEKLPRHGLALHNAETSRQIESWALAQHPPFALMYRAGESVFKLSAALYPHAQTVWVACGPGNNGGDGLVAAALWQRRLQASGGKVFVNWLGHAQHCGPDTQHAFELARSAGVLFETQAPAAFDLAIDALWGLGLDRAPEGPGAAWLNTLQTCLQPVLCVDLPSGLDANSGAWMACSPAEPAGPRHTLSLLTMKPGLWTGQGRACSGDIWFDDLGVSLSTAPVEPSAWLQGPETMGIGRAQQHLGHKGTHGDVLVIGGQWPHKTEAGMVGAAWLAARAALHSGAGRVYVHTLAAPKAHDTNCPSEQSPMGLDPLYPEIMFRPGLAAGKDSLVSEATVVCGCGGGVRVVAWLPTLIARTPTLVLDADALNALALDPAMFNTLSRRHHRGFITVLTPHPLEAARLLGCTVDDIQKNRLHAAQTLAELSGGVVVLKGSGTIVAASGLLPIINPTGNALLGTAGSGDVLAGMLGAALAPHKPLSLKAAQQLCAQTVFAHGLRANRWHDARPMIASDLL
jgi:hydroxyethylthiazole kinase-like uncharacterized protein yjeF